MKYNTALSYSDREGKAKYVFDKYKSIFKGDILDVGADECHLKSYIDKDVSYIGVGMGGNPDMEVNLDKSPLPFDDNKFDCVMCMDVLEHLEQAHYMFDELCRTSKKYVLISLPNPYYDFVVTLTDGKKKNAGEFKFYGLPEDKPVDRHRWFFSSSDARNFIVTRAAKNNFNVLQIDTEGADVAPNLKSRIKRIAVKLLSCVLTIDASDIYERRTWALLEKK